MTLLIIPPLLIHRRPSGRYVLTRKFLDGVAEYQKHWPGRIAVACEPAPQPDSNLDQVEAHPEELPFELHVLDFNDSAAFTAVLNQAGVLLATLVPRQIALAPLFQKTGIPLIYVAEFSLHTRRQIVRVEVSNPLKRLVRLQRETHYERQFHRMLRASAGVQCNGTPTYESYKSISPNPLLYFDSRVTQDMLVSEATLQARLQELQSHRPLRLAFSGRLIAVKGADHLIFVAVKLLENKIPFTLEIFGGGALEESLRTQIARYSLQNDVHLRGNIDFATQLVPHIARHIDLFVCCHRQGDPSCTYLETLSCGTPIAGYANEAFSGIVRASNAGWTVPLDHPAALAETIAHLHQDRAALAAAAKRALTFAKQHTFESTMIRRVDHLMQCAGNPKSAVVQPA